jgi:ABC-type multidrug transport system ATPase subunit
VAQIGFKRLRIEDWRQFSRVDLELHPRLTIITGANGAGKSTLLGFFSRHFGYHRAYLSVPRTVGGLISFSVGLFSRLKKTSWFSRDRSAPVAQQIGEISYIGGASSALRLPASVGLHYSVQIDQQQPVPGIHIDSHRPPNIYRSLTNIPAAPPSSKSIGSDLNNEYMQYFSGGQFSQGSLYHIKLALIQMSIFGHGNHTMQPIPELIDLFKGFESTLRSVLPKSLGFQRLVIRSPEILLSTKSGDFLIDAASGGVIKLFEIAWQLYFFSRSLSESSEFVITLDEPENHLHPSMQKALLPNLLDAFPSAQIIVVTHSPFIITALRDSYVYVLRYEDDEIQTDDDDESIRGLMGAKVFAERLDTINKAGTASEILRDVLGITTTIPDWAESRIDEIVSKYRDSVVSSEVLGRLYRELESEGLSSSYPSAVSELTRRV